jgi:predicted permease
VSITTVIFNVILPVFIIAGAGAVAGRWLKLEVQSLSRSVLYIFGPALVFRSLLTTELSASDAAQIVGFVLITTAMVGLVAWTIIRGLEFSAVRANAFLLSVLLINAGNYGLSVSLFAFGDPGLERAVIFYAVSSVIINTVGVYLASRGRAQSSVALRNVFRVPLVYAVALAFILRAAGITSLPPALFQPIDLLADAAVPVLLLVLGIELAESHLTQELGSIGLAAALRLGVAAGIAIAVAAVMGLDGLTRQVCIIQASMPTAVLSVVLAVEFDTDPQFVTSVVFVSTLLSSLTVTVLLTTIV